MTQEIISETAEDRVNQKPLTSWDSLPLVLTVEEAAQVIGVGCRAIYDLARTKRQGFPVVRLGKSIRIPRDAFRQWLNSRVS
ncbi:MAG: helix-turn-helix domain-containing protein [Peptococcaceae bacterium]|nr:helix-turn-helix domain-containing protein [Peptococcaceae bacterium]